jgi:hypothetical protein
MTRASDLRNFILCSCGMFLLAGCNVSPGSTASLVSSPPVTIPPVSPPATPPAPLPCVTTPSGTTPPPGGTAPLFTQPNIYVVWSGVATDKNCSPDSIFIYSQTQTTTGPLNADEGEIAGSEVSVDSVGNIYVLLNNQIEVIPPTAPYLLETSRSLPVGPGTKIAAVKDMAASLTGEIFVSDGKGIAVFSATATGNADPARYILGNSQAGSGASTAIVPGVIAVDSADTLYVQNTADSSIVVFGPIDTGTVVPSRTIAGPLAGLTSNGAHVTGMTTDTAGNLYLLCQCSWPGSNGTDFGVLEFSPTANGNVAPIRFVTTPAMDSSYSASGVAVDSAGTIYVSGGAWAGAQIFEFSATASGSVAPSNTLTWSYGGYAGSLSGIAVH